MVYGVRSILVQYTKHGSGRRRNGHLITGSLVDRITPTSMTHLSEFQPSVSLSDPNLGLRLQMPPSCARHSMKQKQHHHHHRQHHHHHIKAITSPKRTEASGNISVDLHCDTKSTLKRTKDPSHLRVSTLHAQNAAHAASRTRESRSKQLCSAPWCRLSRIHRIISLPD